MPTVTLTTDIRAPIDAVWAVVADYSRGPEWQKNITSAKWTSDEPHGVGSTFEQSASFMGRDMTASYEVTEHEPQRVTAIKSTTGMDIVVRRELEPIMGGTRITETASGGPGGGARLFSPLMRVMMEKSIRADYQALKALLETPTG